jgi:putative spermidine/putrescine transport system substrate-binding protein
VDSWCILKGTPRADLAREFIKYATSAKAQAAFPPFVANGPVNPAALAMIDPARVRLLPTFEENIKKMRHVDIEWWKANKTTAIDRFNAWILT